jgi:hypothetical protein
MMGGGAGVRGFAGCCVGWRAGAEGGAGLGCGLDCCAGAVLSKRLRRLLLCVLAGAGAATPTEAGARACTVGLTTAAGAGLIAAAGRSWAGA